MAVFAGSEAPVKIEKTRRKRKEKKTLTGGERKMEVKVWEGHGRLHRR